MKVIKRFGWKWSGMLAAAALTMASMAHPFRAMAQDAANASIHGHVQNAVGQAVNSGEVKLTTDRASDAKSRKYEYTFPVDAQGNYKGSGIKPANYVAIYFQADKSVDFFDNEDLKAGEDKQVDFDMTRAEYIAKMTPEEKKQLEEFKKKNADVTAANAKIANLNAALTQARADNKAGNYDAAVTSMTQATEQKPDEPILWLTLGDAQLGSAANFAKGKPLTDAEVQSKYGAAVTSYKKAVDLNAASKKPTPETTAAAYNQLGQAYGRMGDSKNAADAYDQAAKALPANAAMYYFNEAATLYNAHQLDEAAAAADKAVAADPNRADAYYIKGQALIPKATVDPKTQKIVAPPGCVEAYQAYLDKAPDGPHAQEVKDILTGIGAEVKSSYKATSGKKK